MVFDKRTANIIILICSVFLALTILKSFYFSHKSGGGDLRSRIVAARLLFTNKSPYFYKWIPGDSEYYLDPNNHADWPVNTNISSPAELAVIYPVSTLPYQYVRYIWTAMELISAALILMFLFRKLNNPSLVLFFAVAVGLLSTDIWLFHSERGQKYIFYALCFAITYYIAKRNTKNSALLAGVVSGLFIFFRPFLGVLAIAYFVTGKWRLLFGWIAGVVIGFSIFVLPFLHQWNEYFQSMDIWVKLLRGDDVLLKNHPPFVPPAVVEGMSNISIYTGFNIETLKPIPYYLNQFGIKMPNWASGILFCFLAGIFAALYYLKNRKPSIESVFVFAFLLYFIADMSFAVPRSGYVLVQWLFVVPIVVTAYQENKRALIILFSGMLLFHNFPFYFPNQALIAELIFVYYSVMFVIRSNDNRKVVNGNNPLGSNSS